MKLKALVRRLFWFVVAVGLCLAWLGVIHWGVQALGEQPSIICSGSPEECAHVSDHAP